MFFNRLLPMALGCTALLVSSWALAEPMGTSWKPVGFGTGIPRAGVLGVHVTSSEILLANSQVGMLSSTNGIDWVAKTGFPTNTSAEEILNRDGILYAMDVGEAYSSAPPYDAWTGVGGSVPPLYQDAFVLFKGEFFDMGGANLAKPGLHSEIWRSTDCAEWTLADDSPAWGGYRRSVKVAEFQGKLWLTGGIIGIEDIVANDIWSSEDGVTWTLALEHAPWSPQSGRILTVFRERLFFFGSGQVWSSPDGVTWEQELPGDPEMRPNTSFVWDDSLYLIGGNPQFSNGEFRTWRSADGKHWEHVPNTVPWEARESFASARLGEYTYMIGGRDFSGVRGDVWRTVDGSDWERVVAVAPWAARRGHSVVVWDGALWLIGGASLTTLYHDVWRSVDGVAWELVNDACPWAVRYFHGAAVKDGKLWISGGLGEFGSVYGDVWSSDDGATWEMVAANTAWGPRHSHGMAAHAGELWVSCGTGSDGNSLDTVWHSADGVDWVKVPGNVGYRSVAPLRSYGGRLWLSGGYMFASDEEAFYQQDLMSSADGLTWETVVYPAPWDGRMAHGMEFTRGGLLIWGGVNGDFSPIRYEDVWRSRGSLGNHTADLDQGRSIELVELLRAIQLYNSGEFHCDAANVEDGFAPGPGARECETHQSDYAPQDWRISLSELLRLIQFYNSGGYLPCEDGEDGYCPMVV